ncbi:zinc finger protein 658B-like [Ochlerotatus camptorhynchus]|uniref:zinc finger protein 658B-like n=1 Tax=Ochlerotatus camptorhynchus TaxID=644619 RepID=UPI0031E29E34
MDHPVKPQCRLCLAPSPEQYASISDSAVCSKFDIVFKFELPLDDSLPNVVCVECSAKVDEFYTFHEAVRTNQVQLKTAPMTDVCMLLLVEVKGEPLDYEETEETDLGECSTTVADVDQNDNDDDHKSTTKADPVQNKDVQGKRSSRKPDDNCIIEQFFNGITCSVCSEKFETFGKLKIHSMKAHDQKASIECFKCSECDRTMASIYSLKVHMLKMHSEQPREAPATHVCDMCGQVYNQKQSLERHINLQHLGAKDTDRIQCPVCAKWVNNKHYLKVHIRNAHSGENLQVTCDICRQVCANKRALSAHKHKVHAERNLECEVCGKMFKQPKHLKEHRAAHMGQQLYTCTVCGYGSNYNGNLYTHMKNRHPVEYAEAKARGGTLLTTQDEASEATITSDTYLNLYKSYQQRKATDRVQMNPVKPSCRICLEPIPEMYGSITDSALRSKLDVVFKFELPMEDNLSHVICSECSVKIDEFYSFHETVRNNQDQLKALTVAESNMFLMVEVKGEPLDAADMEETDVGGPSTSTTTAFAEVDQIGDDDDDNDDEESAESDQDEANAAPIEEDQDEKSNQVTDGNEKIKQFFDGITCGICSGNFGTFNKLQIHSRKMHDQKASITCCDRKFFRKSFLIEHIDAHLDPTQFYCEPCNRNYGSKHNLYVHNLQAHPAPEQESHQCSVCGKKFTRECFLRAHLKYHVPAQCPMCDRTMSTVYTLKVHMRKVHSEQPRERIPSYSCDTCGKAYHQKQSLQRHINLQHLGLEDTDRIQCPVCAKWVINKHYLKVHIRNLHSEEDLQLPCDICQLVYPTKHSLKNHMKKAHAERNLECDVCGKKFLQPKHLKEHRATHTDHQLYKCTLCDYGSNYNSNLYLHMKNKHPEERAEAKGKGGALFVEQPAPLE